jgi:DNA-binding LytR/AlgR family response regulator
MTERASEPQGIVYPTIMMIDDEKAIMRLMRMVALHAMPHVNFLTFTDFELADGLINDFIKSEGDASHLLGAVIDYQGGAGLVLAQILKTYNSDIVIIGTTGANAEEIESDDIDFWLPKPFSNTEFTSSIKTAFEPRLNSDKA